jgi:hypothetical protein
MEENFISTELSINEDVFCTLISIRLEIDIRVGVSEDSMIRLDF